MRILDRRYVPSRLTLPSHVFLCLRAFIALRTTEDTVLPLYEPIRGKDGTLITEVAVPKGTVALLNLEACNTNKAIWGDDALEWKPERWLGHLPTALEDARIPGVYAHL